MFLLLLGVFKKNSASLIYNLSIVSLIVTLVLIFKHPLETQISLFNNSYKIDYLSSFMKILTLIGAIFVLISSSKYLKIFKILQIEYSILILCSILGMIAKNNVTEVGDPS
jgi:NADH-quinone oxidoreductase subunit N